jgi:DNA-binding response OmpR family regulator
MAETRRILIVDDEPKVAFFLQESLESLGHNYEVVSAASGEAALAEIEHAPFGVVITDLRMPGISGLELMQRVRDEHPQTRTILITAYGSEEVEAEMRRLQAYRYFTKPFRIQDLTAAVQEALREGASSAPGLLVLSGERLDRLTQRLNTLRHEVGAQCVLLADITGQLMAEVGVTDGVSPSALATLFGGSFAAEFELARQMREDHSLNLRYHEGVRYDIYAANVGDQLFITLIFDRRMGASRISMVWLYAKRAIQALLPLVAGDETLATPDALPSEFSASLSNKLNAVWGTA